MRSLTYQTYLTGKADPDEELPMIVSLHFMGSSPEQTFDILLGSFGFPSRVIAPYGPYRHDDHYAWFPDSFYNEDEVGQGKFVDEMVEILLENVESWRREFPTKGKPIFLGVSQGGDMCFTLAAKHADRFRLCLPIAGRLLIDELTKKDQAGLIRIHHGKEDPIVPIDGARKAAKYLLSANLDVEIREFENAGHEVPEEMVFSIQDDIYAAIKDE